MSNTHAKGLSRVQRLGQMKKTEETPKPLDRGALAQKFRVWGICIQCGKYRWRAVTLAESRSEPHVCWLCHMEPVDDDGAFLGTDEPLNEERR